MEYNKLGISDNIIKALNEQNITAPTDIQAQSYQPIIEGMNVIGCSQTGSGKTLAYILPLLSKITPDESTLQAVITVPTQELGIQVLKQLQCIIDRGKLSIKVVSLTGDANINRQIESIKSKPHIIVGTCGRIVKLNKMKKLSLHNVRTLIIDEADKMLDKDNYESLSQLRHCLMKYTQICFFSASMDRKSIEKARTICTEPVLINIKADSGIPATIKHMYIVASRRERVDMLRSVLSAVNSDKTIIFANTAYDLEEVYDKLIYHKYSVATLYGTNTRNDRKNSLESFKNGKTKLLLSTDLASRGLQIDNINTVINIGLPENSKEYQHRSGRCGRNGNQGICISIISENDISKIQSYQKEFGINIIKRKLYKGKLVAR